MRPLALLAAGVYTAMTAVAALAQTPIIQLHCNDANGVPLLNGQTVTVRGIVTSMNPTSAATTRTRLYIQDASGGINVFGLPLYCGNRGDDITVVGTIEQFNGLDEVAQFIAPLSITVNSTGNPQPAALPLTIAQANATYQANNCEPNEGRLVSLTNLLIRTTTGAMPPATFAINGNYHLEHDGPDSTTNWITLFIAQKGDGCNQSPLVDMAIPMLPATVIGILPQFDSSAPFTGDHE